MDLTIGSEAEPFRQELIAWLDAHLTDEVRHAGEQGEDAAWDIRRAWNAVLVDAGYGAIEWPTEYGGRDAGVLEQLVYNEEMSRAGAPGPVNAIGVANIAPAIMSLGTDEQKDRFLRRLLRGDDIWSQGMSEPEAGSDLASLRCRAELDGDHWVVEGQKIWNSNGHRADWCQLYVRTDPEAAKHHGITCLLVDLSSPGVEVRPIVSMADDRGFSEVFFDGARVPVDSVLGEVGRGWQVATTTLSHERAGVAKLYLDQLRSFERLRAEVSDPTALQRQELARRYSELKTLEWLATRSISAALHDRQPGAEGSVIKLAWSRAGQRLARTAVELFGMAALDGPWAQALLSSPSLAIAGGTTEVNKNIVAERVLGLPREPR